MLFRKIESYIRAHLHANSNKILLVEGARQIGKSYIIRKVGTDLFKNYISSLSIRGQESIETLHE